MRSSSDLKIVVMFVEFKHMPDDARIWVYQADRFFSDGEVETINSECKNFLTQWTAHGSGLKSSAKVFYKRFLVICVDEKEAMASGCSIDSSVHFVQTLGEALKTDFFKRDEVAFLLNKKVIIQPLNSIKNYKAPVHINASSLHFNNLIQKKSDIDNKWIIPVSESWLARYLKVQKV